ncbi:Conserved_hypothetical protein [Hexamita inflata]|uniref:Uncharacterized protein n=1 Tax=Hexamita inflata TaxID=28002 RepID=A0AA86R681_9EUKA|nr:Conserved hypothetical protein [Hexamita inflata]CAI9971325.1 Conserved hypothetical protein [Hexamita inflata]
MFDLKAQFKERALQARAPINVDKTNINEYLKDGDIDDSNDSFTDINIEETKQVPEQLQLINQRPRKLQNLAQDKDFGFDLPFDESENSVQFKSTAEVPSAATMRNSHPKPAGFILPRRASAETMVIESEPTIVIKDNKRNFVMKMQRSGVEEDETKVIKLDETKQSKEAETSSETQSESDHSKRQQRKEKQQKEKKQKQQKDREREKKRRIEPSTESDSEPSYEFEPQPPKQQQQNQFRQQFDANDVREVQVQKNQKGHQVLQIQKAVKTTKKEIKTETKGKNETKEKIEAKEPEKIQTKEPEPKEQEMADTVVYQEIVIPQDPKQKKNTSIQSQETKVSALAPKTKYKPASPEPEPYYEPEQMDVVSKIINQSQKQLVSSPPVVRKKSISKTLSESIPQVAQISQPVKKNIDVGLTMNDLDMYSYSPPKADSQQFIPSQSLPSQKVVAKPVHSSDIKVKPQRKRLQKTQPVEEAASLKFSVASTQDFESEPSEDIQNEYDKLTDTLPTAIPDPKMLKTQMVEQSMIEKIDPRLQQLISCIVNTEHLHNRKIATIQSKKRELIKFDIIPNSKQIPKRFNLRQLLGEKFEYQNGEITSVYLSLEVSEPQKVVELKPFQERHMMHLKKVQPDQPIKFKKDDHVQSIQPVVRFENLQFQALSNDVWTAGQLKLGLNMQTIVSVGINANTSRMTCQNNTSVTVTSGELQVKVFAEENQIYTIRQYDCVMLPKGCKFELKGSKKPSVVILIRQNEEESKHKNKK